jgi:hypothetical protein
MIVNGIAYTHIDAEKNRGLAERQNGGCDKRGTFCSPVYPYREVVPQNLSGAIG